MSVDGCLGPTKLEVLRIVERLKIADVRDVRPHVSFHTKALSGMLHDLCAAGYLRKVSSRACMEGRLRGGRGANRVVYAPTGKQPRAVLPARPQQAPRGLRQVPARKGKGSGVIAPPPYRYGFLWLNAGGVAR